MNQASNDSDTIVAVMGSGGVGKTALTVRLVTDNFIPGHEPTIEDTYRLTLKIDNVDEKVGIVDTAGQDQFSSMQDQWIRSSHAFVLVYSIDSQASFNELKVLYEKILRIKESAAVVLAGNKCDLHNRAVPAEHGQALASKWGCAFYETSAKDKINNVEVFHAAVRALRSKAAQVAPKKKRKSRCAIL